MPAFCYVHLILISHASISVLIVIVTIKHNKPGYSDRLRIYTHTSILHDTSICHVINTIKYYWCCRCFSVSSVSLTVFINLLWLCLFSSAINYMPSGIKLNACFVYVRWIDARRIIFIISASELATLKWHKI